MSLPAASSRRTFWIVLLVMTGAIVVLVVEWRLVNPPRSPEAVSVPPPSTTPAPAGLPAPPPAEPEPVAPEPKEPMPPVPNPLTTPRDEFLQAKEEAREQSCRSNLKQIGLAMQMYTMDYDDHFPASDDWCDEVSPYIRNEAIFRCPSLPDERCAYAYNGQLPVRRSAEVRSPAATVMVFEAKGEWNQVGGPELVASRHPEGPVVGFVDGHVKSMGTSAPRSWVWRPDSQSAP